MATNLTHSQAVMATSAVVSTNSNISPVTSENTRTLASSATAVPTSVPQTQGNGPTRTEELILAELQRLSARMSNMEQEIQSTTFTSTPKKRKKTRQANKSREQSTTGVSVLTDTQTTIDDNLIEVNQLVSNSTSRNTPIMTIVTSASSLFTQTSTVTTSATGTIGASYRPITHVSVASCQTGHYRHHIPQMTQAQGNHMRAGPVAHSEHNLVNAITTRPTVAFALQPQTVTTQSNSQVNSQGLQMQQGVRYTPGATQLSTNANPQPQCACGGQSAGTQAPFPVQAASQGNPSQWTNMATQGIAAASVGATTSLPDDQILIPSLQALRSTAVNQELVQRRLDELHQQAAPQQSGNSSSTLSQDTCKNTKTKGKKEKVDVVWPQDCAFVGHQRSRLTYEQWNQSQFVLGFLRSVQEETNIVIRSNMIEYLTDLFQDVCDMGWQSAKGAHLVVMSKMEDGLVTWGDLKKVGKIRKTYVRSGMGSNNSSNSEQHTGSGPRKGFKKPSTIPCKEFNDGKCTKTFDHDVGLITHRHICAFCLYAFNRQYNHAEVNCNKKKVKNGQAALQQ